MNHITSAILFAISIGWMKNYLIFDEFWPFVESFSTTLCISDTTQTFMCRISDTVIRRVSW